MSRYIDADALTSKVRHFFFELIDKVEPIMTEDGGAFDLKIVNPLLETNKVIASIIREQPTVDAVRVVRCKDCKFRIVNEHYGEDGYMKLKAICDKDTGDPFELGRNVEDDEWFCADGERREDAEIH